METKLLLKQAKKLSDKFLVTDGRNFRLKKIDPANTLDFDKDDKPRAEAALVDGVRVLAKLQDKLYAQDRWSVLLIFQAMDAAGKDSAIKHVMTGVNPQGCEVYSFKSPTAEELDHDYLWRCAKRLPERGRIGIFNRSYYEETLVVRVHEEFLASQKLPGSLVTKDIWTERLSDISNFERYLTHNGIAVVKFFLHVSRDEQKKRFLERIDNPEKNWKFSLNDIHERQHWSQYMKAYEETIQATATKFAPWYVVPADNKWFTRIIVASAVVKILASLNLQYPQLSKNELKALDAAKVSLLEKE
jgi:PPK2 family polyphosphate:nucleotide phosphotransferase